MSDTQVLDTASRNDFDSWIELAAEVEHLFGPMCSEPEFRSSLEESIEQGRAWCVRGCDVDRGSTLCGGIIVEPEENKIAWLAVAKDCRGLGIGRLLLNAALQALDTSRDIPVRTFAAEHPDGVPARTLYLSAGFRDLADAELTSSGVTTVNMVRPGDSSE